MKIKIKLVTIHVDCSYFGFHRGDTTFMLDVLPILNIHRILWHKKT